MKILIYFSIFFVVVTGVFALNNCTDLITENEVYDLENDINSTGTCITIMANNITIDCHGYIINYSNGVSGAIGINSSYNYTTVKNCIIKKGSSVGTDTRGIQLTKDYNYIYNNSFYSPFTFTYSLYLSGNLNLIENNTITAGGSYSSFPIRFVYSNHSLIKNNIINTTCGDNSAALSLYRSFNNTFLNNNLTSSQGDSVRIEAMYPYSIFFNHSIDDSNLAEGLPINYTFNQKNIILENQNMTKYGEIIFGNCNNISIINNTFSKDSLVFFYTPNITMEDNFINSSTGWGLHLYYSNNGSYKNNKIYTTGVYGIGLYVEGSYSNYFFNNSITTTSSSSAMGIRHISSNNNIFNYTTVQTGYSWGMYVQYVEIFKMYNSKIFSRSYPMYLIGMSMRKSNITFEDTILNASSPANGDLYLASTVSGEIWNLTNVTRADGSSIHINWSLNANGTLNNFWWLELNTNIGANVTINDINDNYRNFLSDGYNKLALQEYSNINNTVLNSFNNYTVNVNLTGYYNITTTINMSFNNVINLPLTPLSGDCWTKDITLKTLWIPNGCQYTTNVLDFIGG